MSHIIGAHFEPPIRYNREETYVLGDTWSTAWADNDVLYTITDDTSGFEGMLIPTGGRNLALQSFGTSKPPLLKGTLINDLSGFGHRDALLADGASWKGNGLAAIDGTLYLTASRHTYGQHTLDHRQPARNASILKSDDYGKTWQNHLGESNVVPPITNEACMFPGPKFATPFFVEYGQDGKAPARDEADRYVYAVSTDGFWDNGNAMFLGRVRRDKLARLNRNDWEFAVDITQDAQSGHEKSSFKRGQPIWQAGLAGLEAATPILRAPGRCGQTGIHYVPGIDRYILPQWSYPRLVTEGFPQGVQESIWEFYEAPHPWGPWTLFQQWTWKTEGFYNPYIPNKFMSEDGLNMWVLATGYFMTFDQPPETSLYTLHMLHMQLHTTP